VGVGVGVSVGVGVGVGVDVGVEVTWNAPLFREGLFKIAYPLSRSGISPTRAYERALVFSVWRIPPLAGL